jgi:hypothetical protein
MHEVRMSVAILRRPVVALLLGAILAGCGDDKKWAVPDEEAPVLVTANPTPKKPPEPEAKPAPQPGPPVPAIPGQPPGKGAFQRVSNLGVAHDAGREMGGGLWVSVVSNAKECAIYLVVLSLKGSNWVFEESKALPTDYCEEEGRGPALACCEMTDCKGKRLTDFDVKLKTSDYDNDGAKEAMVSYTIPVLMAGTGPGYVRAAVIAEVSPKIAFTFADGITFDYEKNYGHRGGLAFKDLNGDGIEDIRIQNTFFYNCTFYDDNAYRTCKRKDERGFAYEKLEDRDYIWDPAGKRFKPSTGQGKYSCSIPEQ